MGVERYAVDAVVLEGLTHREAAQRTGLSKAWVTKLVARFRQGGYGAIEPRSKRPNSCAHAVHPEIEADIVRLRRELSDGGFDCGAQPIRYHLEKLHPGTVPSLTTIWRILRRRGLVEVNPRKRPRSSFIRFEAELPNEMWQSDMTHWQLADGTDVEILNYLDDHSRFLTACVAFSTVKGLDVVEIFHMAADEFGTPYSVLTDNGAIYTGKLRKGKVLFESELERLGVVYKNSRPYHPQTCGKVERFHQTLKKYLSKQVPPRTIAELQLQLDTFRAYYNNHRPHRALNGATPLMAYNARLKARPATPEEGTHFRVRHDKVDKVGTVTLRYLSRLRHIRVGAAHAGKRITLLVANKHVRIIDEHGSLLRELWIDPTRDYQPLGSPHARPSSGHYLPRQVGTMS